jgi:catalase-peroxidase
LRYLGPDVPQEIFTWQDPVPPVDHELINEADIAELKALVLTSGLTVSELVGTAWASASTFRGSDKRGGANGARIRLEPMKDWEVNNPEQLNKALTILEEIQTQFQAGGKRVSLADLIVLAGAAGIEKAAQDAGVTVTVPFIPGRTDATQEQTDVDSLAWLQPIADGFRNYRMKIRKGVSTEELLIDKAHLLTLTAPELTVLLGGLRSININYDGSQHGVFTDRPGQLTNDFFVNLLDMATEWKAVDETKEIYIGTDRQTGKQRWMATRADLVFGSNSELRALAEVYGSADVHEKFIADFVSAWNKVMHADRFDLK